MQLTKKNSDVLKGIAIILVVAEHVMGNYFQTSSELRNYMGTGGVSLFLILSGYGVYLSYQQNGLNVDYWNKKINKIFLPYWITTLLFGIYIKSSNTILLKNLLCVDYDRNYDGTMWYMSLLLIEYAAFFIIFYCKGFDIVKICLLVILGLVIKENQGLFRACGWQFSNNYLSFPFGVLLGYISSKLFKAENKLGGVKEHIKTICAIFMIIGFLALYVYGITAKWSFQTEGILLCLMLISIVVTVSESIQIPLKILGEVSYPIYLVEGKIFEIIWKISPDHSFGGGIITIIYMVILFISTIAVNMLCKIINKKCGFSQNTVLNKNSPL